MRDDSEDGLDGGSALEVLWTVVVLLFFLQPTWINIKMAPVWNSTTWNGFNWRCQNIFWSSWKNKYLNGQVTMGGMPFGGLGYANNLLDDESQ